MFYTLLLSCWVPYTTLSLYFYWKDEWKQRQQYKRIAPTVLFNVFLLLPLWLKLILRYFEPKLFVTSDMALYVGHLMGFLCLFELVFYFTHRFMHRVKWFFRNIHTIHHELKKPVGFGSLYCHPLEFMMCNMLPMTLGPLCFSDTAMLTHCVWLTFGTSFIVISHSGHVPNDHLKHHALLTGEYGTTGFLDWLFNTRLQ